MGFECSLRTYLMGENLSLVFGSNKGADQPVHQPSLISVFVICFIGKYYILTYYKQGFVEAQINYMSIYCPASSDLSICISSSGVYKLVFYLTIVNETWGHCLSLLGRQYQQHI